MQEVATMAETQDTNRWVLKRLRAVPGIDVDAGLAFLGNSAEMYVRLLNRFVALHEPDVAALSDPEVPAGDPRLQRLCHTIRGGAATLGLRGLAQAAQQLEQLLRDGASPAQIAELARVLAASHAMLRDLLQPEGGG
jgi:HPt (histidine-containing phosphotransfer) domain-containing protein